MHVGLERSGRLMSPPECFQRAKINQRKRRKEVEKTHTPPHHSCSDILYFFKSEGSDFATELEKMLILGSNIKFQVVMIGT